MPATPNIDSIHLKGAHRSRAEGLSVTEAIAYVAGEEHSDRPACLSPVLGAFLSTWSDALDDETRQRLLPYVPRAIGTADDGRDERRGWLALDWLVRVHAPAWLELYSAADLVGHARALRALPELRDEASLGGASGEIAATAAAAECAAAMPQALNEAELRLIDEAIKAVPRADRGRAAAVAAWAAARTGGGAAAGAAGFIVHEAAPTDAAWAVSRKALSTGYRVVSGKVDRGQATAAPAARAAGWRVAGIVAGIVAGVAAGIAAGIAVALLAGIVAGIVAGIAAAVVAGIAAGAATPVAARTPLRAAARAAGMAAVGAVWAAAWVGGLDAGNALWIAAGAAGVIASLAAPAVAHMAVFSAAARAEIEPSARELEAAARELQESAFELLDRLIAPATL